MDETILDERGETPEEETTDTPAESDDARVQSWSDELSQVAERTSHRAERWVVDQRRRLADGLDALLIDLERRRAAEVARIEAWRGVEHERIQVELDAEFARGRERVAEDVEQERARMLSEVASERERLQSDIADERERFHEQMLAQLKAFEEQLALRLMEQEERIARWWDEAETMSANRFRALGLERGRES